MTKTEFIGKMLDAGNRAGAYSLEEARSGSECLESIKRDLELLEKIVEKTKAQEEAEAKPPEDPKKNK